MAYYQFQPTSDDDDAEPFGSFETFRTNEGWFWQACYPGCLPDSEDPTGPFTTEQEAIADANDC